MRRLYFILIILFSFLYTRGQNLFFNPSDSLDRPVSLLKLGKSTYYISSSGIALVEKQKSVTLKRFASPVRAAAVLDKKIYIGTDSGLFIFNPQNKELLEDDFFRKQKISSLTIDAGNSLWVGAMYSGCFLKHKNNDYEQKLNIPGILSLCATPDSNVWIGTNVGLYKMSIKDYAITRYAEEGYSGYELPDNIIEQLYQDRFSNIWVVMPDNISFKRGNSYTGENPTYDFIGVKNNKIFSITDVSDRSYLFITENGTYFLPYADEDAHHHHGGSTEIYGVNSTTAYTVDFSKLNFPPAMLGQKIYFSGKIDKQIYLFTKTSVYRISEKKLLNGLKKQSLSK